LSDYVVATIATLVNNKKHLFLFFLNKHGDPGGFEENEQLFGFGAAPQLEVTEALLSSGRT